MPLEILADPLDATTDEQLAFDKAVEKDLEESLLASVSDMAGQIELLYAIIENSNDDLEKKYQIPKHARRLIAAYPELGDMLTSAWKRKSFYEIRNLAVLKASATTQVPKTPGTEPVKDSDQLLGLAASFAEEYRGAAVDGFYEYLTCNQKLFEENKSESPYYAKFCSIVQSSGTGKSRILTELRKKDVIVIYMNLREKQDVVGFPHRDGIPADILTNFPPLVEEYQTVCYAFFIALFDTLDEYLAKARHTRSSTKETMRWVDMMCDMKDPGKNSFRNDFFEKLSEKYEKVHSHLSEGDVTEQFQSLAVSAKKQKAVQRDPHPLVSPRFSTLLFEAYKRIGERITNLFPEPGDRPTLVIAMDEAHPLSHHVREPNGYRPADVFCRAVSNYSHAGSHAIWVVFASTTSRVADFSPPNHRYNSSRVAIDGQHLFSPYTQLGWDQNARRLGDIGAEEVSMMDHILGYGRPLWHSLKKTYQDSRYVWRTTSTKLYGCGTFDPSDKNHVLAILGQRFGLNVTLGHPDSVEYVKKGVASHLRICLATTLDRNWLFTTYPSEPFLSCVAAYDLHEKPEKLGTSLNTLYKVVNSGMIDIGQRGELASRLLWLLSKDLFVRTRAKNVNTGIPEAWEAHIADCEMIPVVDWLEFIFGPKMWDRKDMQASTARAMFKDAYLNFSHWVCMEAIIAGSKAGQELGLEEWTLRHWQRTSAVQCFHPQPLIDKMIPIYFKGAEPIASRMSQIFISDKARESKHSKGSLHDITRRSEFLTSANSKPSSNSQPYIAILADLAQPPSFSVTFPERDVDDRCLRIYTAGVDTTIYPFLANYPEVMKVLGDLARLQTAPETDRPFTEYLNKQVKYGTTATSDHMLWEQGSSLPNLRTPGQTQE